MSEVWGDGTEDEVKIDVSRMKQFRFCPLAYFERYVTNIEPVARDKSPLAFGTAFHAKHENMVRVQLGQPALAEPELDESLTPELATTWAAYEAHYPQNVDAVYGEFKWLAAEHEFCVPVPEEFASHIRCDCGQWVPEDIAKGQLHSAPRLREVFDINCPKCHGGGFQPRHWIIGKRDAVIEHRYGKSIYELKTQSRSSKDNVPQAWAARTQASVYLWASAQDYGEEFHDLLLDVVVRQSPAGREPAMFPERQHVSRSREQLAQALRDLVYWADAIETLEAEGLDWEHWPRNSDNCYKFWPCDYASLHVIGRDDETIRTKFQPAAEYLGL
jgi:PD-(D/E)XK nuclease superfamily